MRGDPDATPPYVDGHGARRRALRTSEQRTDAITSLRQVLDPLEPLVELLLVAAQAWKRRLHALVLLPPLQIEREEAAILQWCLGVTQRADESRTQEIAGSNGHETYAQIAVGNAKNKKITQRQTSS